MTGRGTPPPSGGGVPDRPHGRQVDMLVHADRFGRQVGRQREATGRTARGPVIDDPIGSLGEDAAVSFMPRLGAARAGLLAAFLAVGGRAAWRTCATSCPDAEA